MPDITVILTEQHQACLVNVCDAALKYGGLSATSSTMPLIALVQQAQHVQVPPSALPIKQSRGNGPIQFSEMPGD
jgi:hypothetical protein